MSKKKSRDPFPKKGSHSHPQFGIYRVERVWSESDTVGYELSGHKSPGFTFNYDRTLKKWAPTVNAALEAGDWRFMYNTLDEALTHMVTAWGSR